METSVLCDEYIVSGGRQCSIAKVFDAVRDIGFAIIPGVVDCDQITEITDRMYAVQEYIHRDIGIEKLSRAGELGVLRLMMKYDSYFLSLLDIPVVKLIVDMVLSKFAVLHLQNGFILPPAEPDHSKVFQRRLHMDFPRVLNGFFASLNILFCISDFSAQNGGTKVLPKSHQGRWNPQIDASPELLDVECPAGSVIVFDSTLWHCAGVNSTKQDRLGINHQFTHHYFKQQIDYVRALDPGVVSSQSNYVQALLGMNSRVPVSLDDYYVPADLRLYKGGQG